MPERGNGWNGYERGIHWFLGALNFLQDKVRLVKRDFFQAKFGTLNLQPGKVRLENFWLPSGQK